MESYRELSNTSIDINNSTDENNNDFCSFYAAAPSAAPSATAPLGTPYKHVTCRHCHFSLLCKPGASNHCAPDTVPRRTFKRGQNLFQPGEVLEHFMVIREGAVKCFSLNSDGSEQITRFVLPGEILSLEAYGCGRQQCYAQAVEATQVCLFHLPELQAHWTKNAGFQQHFMKLLSNSLAKQSRICRLLNKTSADTRLAAFLMEIIENHADRQLRHDDIRLPMPRSDIGNYLSLALETISRVMSRFEKRGLIHVTGKHIQILDMAGLKALIPESFNLTEA